MSEDGDGGEQPRDFEPPDRDPFKEGFGEIDEPDEPAEDTADDTHDQEPAPADESSSEPAADAADDTTTQASGQREGPASDPMDDKEIEERVKEQDTTAGATEGSDSSSVDGDIPEVVEAESPAGGGSPGASTQALGAVLSIFRVNMGVPRPFARLGELLFRNFFNRRFDKLGHYRKRLNQAKIDTPADVYLSQVAGRTLGLASLAGIALLLALQGVEVPIQAAPIPQAAIRVLLALGAAMFVGIPVGYHFYTRPRAQARRRSHAIGRLLPQTLAYLYALARSDMTVLDIVERVAKSQDTYGEAAREFEVLLAEMRFNGSDLRAALQHASTETPNDALGDLFADMVEVLNERGNLAVLLESRLEELREEAEFEQGDERERLIFVITMYGLSLIPLLIGIHVAATLTPFSAGGLYGVFALLYIALPLLSVLTFWSLSGWGPDDSLSARTLPAPNNLSSSNIERWGQADEGQPALADGGVRPVNEQTASADEFVYSRLAPSGGDLSGIEQAGLDQIKAALRSQEIWSDLRALGKRLLRAPQFTAALTIPLAAVYLATLLQTDLLNGISSLSTPLGTTLVVVVPVVIVITPIALLQARLTRRKRIIHMALPEFMTAVAAAGRDGASLSKRISIVAGQFESPLSGEVKRLHNELAGWTVPVEGALARAANRVENPRFTRTMKTLMDSNTSDHSIQDVLWVLRDELRTAANWDREHSLEMRIYTALIGGLSAIVIVYLYVFQALFFGDATLALRGLTLPVATLTYHGTLIQAVASGVILGRLRYSDGRAGLRYSLGFLALAVGLFVGLPALGVGL